MTKIISVILFFVSISIYILSSWLLKAALNAHRSWSSFATQIVVLITGLVISILGISYSLQLLIN